MSQADNLLNDMTARTMTVRGEEEPHIIINPDRTIVVPEELLNIAVQYDHNIETVTIDCPRYWDDNDLSVMDLTILYTRPDGEPGEYEARNVVVEDDIIHFDWTLEHHATGVDGNLKIQICAKLVNEDTIEEKHWSSLTNTDMYVAPGLPHCAELVINNQPKRIVILTDQTTGTEYEIFVQDGYLKMTERV